MHDIKFIRENPELFDDLLNKRGLEPVSAKILSLDKEFRNLTGDLQELRTRRNEIAAEIAKAKAKSEDGMELMSEAKSISESLKKAEKAESGGGELREFLLTIPNLPFDEVPQGENEDDNKEISKWGDLREFDFEAKEHFTLGEKLGLMDFETATSMSGSRFVLLKGELARLERALAQFMLDIHINEFGYEEISPPYLVTSKSLLGTGQLPKFADDLYQSDDLWLIPTAEVSLTNIVREKIISGGELPLRFVAHTVCFRREAGAAGRDTRGMLRQHQFSKVELVSIVDPDQSEAEHERMTNCAEEILRRLELPYRKILLCTGDMGFSARKTYDLEVFLPGQKKYREVSSCSNCGDFQARRMNSRYKYSDGRKGFIHSLNGSGLAVGRSLIAVMENYQRDDGGIDIPKDLQKYTGFSLIRSNGT